ncbi:MAG: VanZ family protein [Gemmatimonadaceae bacterium]
MTRQEMPKAQNWRLSVFWCAVILIGTSIPGALLHGVPLLPGADKFVHAFLYGTLGFLCWRSGLLEPTTEGTRRLIVLWALIALFAVFDEWHQQFIPGRSTDVADWLADMAGATIGLTISRAAPGRRGLVS